MPTLSKDRGNVAVEVVGADPVYVDRIYMDKSGDDTASYNWAYYRLTSVDSFGNPAGKEGSNIEICQLKWPSLGDLGASVEASGGTRIAIARPSVNEVLAEWGIDHEKRGILIGLRERVANAPSADIHNPAGQELGAVEARFTSEDRPDPPFGLGESQSTPSPY
jgi:hypothetical protein